VSDGIHRLDPTHHRAFLAEGRTDAFTQTRFQVGQIVVICARCKSAHLLVSWRAALNRCCACRHEIWSHERFPDETARPPLSFKSRRETIAAPTPPAPSRAAGSRRTRKFARACLLVAPIAVALVLFRNWESLPWTHRISKTNVPPPPLVSQSSSPTTGRSRPQPQVSEGPLPTLLPRKPALVAEPPRFSDEEARNLVIKCLSARQNSQIDLFVSCHAEQVDWFDEGLRSRAQIERQQRVFLQTRRLTILSPSKFGIEVRESNQPMVKEVRFSYEFLVEQPEAGKRSRGQSDNTWLLKKVGNGVEIIATREIVWDRRTVP